MDFRLIRFVVGIALSVAMTSAFADARVYIDENGHQQIEYIKGWENPDYVITDMTEKDFNAMQESIRVQKEKRAVENAIRNTMFETGLNRTQAIEYMLSPKK
jgi:hypothetical protein